MSRPLAVWQRVCLSVYVALFAGVLPFICLGALGEPGHPHRFPHFVFAMPRLALAHPSPTHPVVATANVASTHHDHHSTVAEQPEPLPAAATAATPTVECHVAGNTVPGRATATLMLFVILLVVPLGGGLIDPWAAPHFVLRTPFAFLNSITITVPLPPPRLLAQG